MIPAPSCRRRPALLLPAALLALFACGCGDGVPVAPAKIVHDGPAILCGALAKPLPRKLLFSVHGPSAKPDAYGALVPNAHVAFEIFEHPEGSPGTLVPDMALSDAGGVAAAVFTPGPVPGVYRIRARLVDVPAAGDALVTVLGGVLAAGGGQDGWIGRPLAEPLSIRLETAPGVFARGGQVRFDPVSGPAIALDRHEAVLADDGVAIASVRLVEGFGRGAVAVTLLDTPLGDAARGYPVTMSYFALNPWALACTVLGGLALFVFGMGLMSDGLQFLAGDRMRALLNALTTNRFAGVGVGMAVTAVIQSSSACTVMVVGFVNAGLMKLAQAIGVIIGSNIGTTVTAQLIAFKLDDLALPAVALGMLLQILIKSRAGKFGGQLLIGFGLLFLGLTLMGGTLSTLKDSALVRDLFAKVACEPDAQGHWSVSAFLLAVGLGTLVTMVVQSSSVTSGILIVLAGAGLLEIHTAYAILLGENIGTTVTAVIAAAGGTTAAKRAAAFHVLFNTVGVVVMVALQFVSWPGTGRPVFMEFVHRLTGGDNFQGENLPRFLANAHTFFNIATALYFLPLLNAAARFCAWLIPDDPAEEAAPARRRLEPRLLATPALAMQQAWGEISDMLAFARKAHAEACAALLRPADPDWDKLAEFVQTCERESDDFQAGVTTYLGQLSLSSLNERQGDALPLLLAGVNDIEKLGDYSRRLLKLARRVRKRSLPFSPEAVDEMERLVGAVGGFFDLTGKTLLVKGAPGVWTTPERQKRRDEVRDAARAIKGMASAFRKRHELRHEAGRCDIRSGVVFLDYLQTCSRIGNHLLSLSRAACDAED